MKSTYFGVPCFAWVKSYFQQITITYYVWILQVDLNCYFYFFSYTFFEIWDSKAWLGVWTLTNLTWTRLCARTRYLMSIPINVRWPTFFEWYQSNHLWNIHHCYTFVYKEIDPWFYQNRSVTIDSTGDIDAAQIIKKPFRGNHFRFRCA